MSGGYERDSRIIPAHHQPAVLIDLALSRDLDPHRILRGSGLFYEDLGSAQVRISPAQMLRLIENAETLLGAVNHAATEQRAAIDALVASAADMLGRVGSEFGQKAQAQAQQLDDAAAQLTGSAVDVASLGDAFGAAVQQFGESNQALAARLQGIEAALDKSLARSDEQMAYYVAQAREVVDLSMLAQKQIIEDLQQLADQRASKRAQAA